MNQPSPWIVAAGVFDFALALFHVAFWKLFRWPASLSSAGTVNSGITQILNLAIAYLFGSCALVCFLFPSDLAATALGRFWLVAMALFWLARALVQPVYFSLRNRYSLALFGVFGLGAVLHGIAGASSWVVQ